MKLIDKEALLLALKRKRYSKQSLDLIESQPVVDAIPVEWIKKWLNETEDDRIVCFDIRNMLADWEKENDGRDC